MKRKLAALLLVCFASVGMMTACGSKKAEVDASQNTDLSDQVTDENTIDGSMAYEKFITALDNMENADSVQIDSETLIEVNYDDGAIDKSSQRYSVKRSKTTEGDRLIDFTIEARTLADANDPDSVDPNATSSDPDNIDYSTNGYYKDGTFYLDQNKEKGSDERIYLRQDMAEKDVTGFISSSYAIGDISADFVGEAAQEETKNGTHYIFIMDKEKITDYMVGYLSYMGFYLSEGESFDLNYSNVSVDLDKNGDITDYTFTVDASITRSDGKMDFSYKVASAFTGLNSTKVKERSEDELSKYITNEEYQQQLQSETEEPSGKQLTPEEIEALGIDPEQFDVELITGAQ